MLFALSLAPRLAAVLGPALRVAADACRLVQQIQFAAGCYGRDQGIRARGARLRGCARLPDRLPCVAPLKERRRPRAALDFTSACSRPIFLPSPRDIALGWCRLRTWLCRCR